MEKNFFKNFERKFEDLKEDCQIYRQEIIEKTLEGLEGSGIPLSVMTVFEQKNKLLKRFSTNKGYVVEYHSNGGTCYNRMVLKFFRNGKITLLLRGTNKKDFKNKSKTTILQFTSEIKSHLCPGLF